MIISKQDRILLKKIRHAQNKYELSRLCLKEKYDYEVCYSLWSEYWQKRAFFVLDKLRKRLKKSLDEAIKFRDDQKLTEETNLVSVQIMAYTDCLKRMDNLGEEYNKLLDRFHAIKTSGDEKLGDELEGATARQ